MGALLANAPDARAQPTEPSAASPPRSSAQFTLRREEAGGAEAQAARSYASAGDCERALEAFDAALEKSTDPTVRRDRGLCHETLGHPFPAIEDYRAYLHAAPDAADADAIRQRLADLEEQTGTGGSGARPTKGAAASASVSVDASSGSARADAATSASSFDDDVAQEKLTDMADSSPLRRGSGVVLGPFIHMPRFFVGERARDQLGYGVGLALRYSTGPTVSVISEIGYAGIGASGSPSAQSGPLLLGGIELRLPVSRFASDHILLRAGVGYERHVVSGTRAINDNILGRFGVGYRHVFGPAIGLELLADGGPAYIIPENADSRLNVLLGGSVAFVVGF